MKQLYLLLTGMLLAFGSQAQCRLDLTNYQVVFDESFDNLTHPRQLASRWQFRGDDTLATFGGGEYYVDPITNNFANLELRTETVGGVSTKYLRLKSTVMQPGDWDYNHPIWNKIDATTGQSWNNNGRAKFRSTLLMTKRGASAGPSPAPFDLSDDPNNPNSQSRGFLYGAFEIRMRQDFRDTYPAFWLYGEATGPLPGPAYWQPGIQLNIFEGSGYNYRSDNSYSVGYDDEGQAGYPGQGLNVKKHGSYLSNDFHTYSGVWTPDQITFFFDGREVATFTGPANTTNFIRNIRNRPAQLIASLQMYPWHNQDANLDVDYIRVYKSSVAGTPFPAYKSTTEWMYFDVLKSTSSAVPAVASYGAITLKNDGSTPHVFYRGTDNYLYQATLQNSSWAAQQVPYNYPSVANSVLIQGDIAYSSLYNKVFFVGQDNRVQFFAYWNGWYHYFVDDNWNSGAELASAQPGSLVTTNDGKIVYRGQDNKIHIFEYDAGSDHWNPSAILANSSLSYTSANLVQGSVSVASNGQIFYQGLDNYLYTITLNAATNSYVLTRVGDRFAATPAVASGPGKILPVSTTTGLVDVYYINTNGQLSIAHATGSSRRPWQVSTAAYTYGSGELLYSSLAWDATFQRIFYIGSDGRVQYLHLGSGGWEHVYVDSYRAHEDFLSFAPSASATSSLLTASDGNAVYYGAANGKLSSFAWGTCQVTNPSSNAGDPTTWPTLNRMANSQTTLLAITPASATEKVAGLSLYPNPTANSLHIAFNTKSSAQSSGTIYNQLGQVVIKLSTIEPKHELDVSQIPAGLYLVVVQQGQNTYRAKFTKL